MGDRGAGTMPFHAGFKRAGTGIHTVEGNIAGSRAAALTKRREEEQQEYEKKKAKIQQDARRGALKIGDKFGGSASDQYDAMFKAQTIGLVTAEQFKQARLLASESAGQAGGAAGDVGGNIGDEDNLEKRKALIQREEEKKKRRKKKKMLAQLSFGDDVEEEGEEGQQEEAAAAKKPRKDPAVDTSFLPDREREQRLVAEREKLRAEWLETQEKVKGEPLEITYSYWDGSGHRRIIRVTKGTTIGKFLEAVRQDLSKEFSEMLRVSSMNLMYIKEDLIIPHHHTFYDLILTKARGKSGPLFHFDVHEDVRLKNDATVEKDESHPGKVCERRWYERSKHIFPASRWETYDPAKSFGSYTIHGGEVN